MISRMRKCVQEYLFEHGITLAFYSSDVGVKIKTERVSDEIYECCAKQQQQ